MSNWKKRKKNQVVKLPPMKKKSTFPISKLKILVLKNLKELARKPPMKIVNMKSCENELKKYSIN
jgi:hypothetical protein